MDALALLPVVDLDSGIDYLRQNTPEGLDILLDYFVSTYCRGTLRRVGGRDNNGDFIIRRVAPLFPPQMWNVHDVTLAGEQRTNNLCEAWNHRIEHLVGAAHPPIWQLIKWLKADAASASTILLKYSRGELPNRRQNRTYLQLQARLRQLCIDRRDQNKSVEEFLRGAGHNIRWKAKRVEQIHVE